MLAFVFSGACIPQNLDPYPGCCYAELHALALYLLLCPISAIHVCDAGIFSVASMAPNLHPYPDCCYALLHALALYLSYAMSLR